mgnify:CR=1 FL=1
MFLIIPPNFQFLFIGFPKIQLIISVYMLQKVSYYFIYSKSILNRNVAIFLSFISNSICYKLGIWFFIHIPPYVKPPPKPISNSLSFNCILLLLIPSYHASGMDAAEVLPYFLTLSKHLSIGIFNSLQTASSSL